MEGKLLPFVVRPAVVVGIVDGASEFYSGCAVVDVAFPKLVSADVDEIRFKNYYVAYLSVLARFRTAKSPDDKSNTNEWKTVVRSMCLMPHPHCEQSSEDYFLLRSIDMLLPLRGVSELRFVLQQPSPQWKEFKLEELQLFGLSGAAPSEPAALPGWLTELDKEGATFRDEERQLKGVSSVSEISKRLQQMWALTVEAGSHEAPASLGRYDIDGCYDVNVLSYT
jgi:nicolin-1